MPVTARFGPAAHARRVDRTLVQAHLHLASQPALSRGAGSRSRPACPPIRLVDCAADRPPPACACTRAANHSPDPARSGAKGDAVLRAKCFPERRDDAACSTSVVHAAREQHVVAARDRR